MMEEMIEWFLRITEQEAHEDWLQECKERKILDLPPCCPHCKEELPAEILVDDNYRRKDIKKSIH